MGAGNWSSKSWDDYKKARNITSTSTVRDIYTSTRIKDSLNPLKISVRESCDSDEHPESTPVILGLDVTGSMGYLAEEIAKTALNDLILKIYDEKPITDPQVMVMAIGDCYSDDAPLQATQFESDIRVAEQMTDIYFEGCGGGNGGESYLAAWYFAAKHTSIDSINNHGKKGWLVTIGDEPDHKMLTKQQIKTFFGDDVPKDISEKELLAMVSEKYNVYHICVGRYKSYGSDAKWKKVLGENVVALDDYKKIPETITKILKYPNEPAEVKEPKSNLKEKTGDSLIVM